MDTANADEHPNFPDRYAAQFAELAGPAEGKPAWLVSHRPIWGVDWLDQGTFQTSNVTLQHALRHDPHSAMPEGVELVLSGHIHRFEALTFPNTQRPPQLVVGNSGISLETDELAGKFETDLDGAACGASPSMRSAISMRGRSRRAAGPRALWERTPRRSPGAGRVRRASRSAMQR